MFSTKDMAKVFVFFISGRTLQMSQDFISLTISKKVFNKYFYNVLQSTSTNVQIENTFLCVYHWLRKIRVF